MGRLFLLAFILNLNSCFAKETENSCSWDKVSVKNEKQSKSLTTKELKGHENEEIFIKYGLFSATLEKKYNSFVYLFKCEKQKPIKLKFFNFEIKKMYKVSVRNGSLEVIFADQTELVGDIYWSLDKKTFIFEAHVDEEI